jgi:hypothetical protein
MAARRTVMHRFHPSTTSSLLIAALMIATSGTAIAQREGLFGLCHTDEAAGSVVYLEVPEAEIRAHMSHGDWTAPNGPDDCVTAGDPSEEASTTESPTIVEDVPALVAQDDEFEAEPGIPLVVPAPGVLANDRGATSAALVREPSWGSLDLGRDGSFTYVADRENPGSDGFAYQAMNEEGAIDIGEVYIVLPPGVNAAPVAVDDTYTFTGSAPYSIPAPGVLANDSDPDGDPISVVFLGNGGAKGACEWVNELPDGSFSILLESGETSTWCEVTITDGVSQATSILSLAIVLPAGAPVGTWDSYALAPGGTLTVPAAQGVLANDISPAGNPLEVSLFAGPFDGGSVTLNSDGSFTFTDAGNPTPGPLDVFIYQLTDTVTGASVAVGVQFHVP